MTAGMYRYLPAPEMPDDPASAGWVYIAGPMTGYPEWNHPAFYEMADRLRAAGHTVICPAEQHAPSHDVAWDLYLRRDLVQLVKCSRVALLKGWHNSRGAALERNVAEALGLEIIAPHEVYDKLIAPAVQR